MAAPFRRSFPVRDETFRYAWSASRGHCQACGMSERDAVSERWPGLSVHHIVKSGRSDEACNLLKLCQRCHDLAELRAIRSDGVLLPKLTLGVCLAIKRLRDPGEWDDGRLAALRGRPLPDPEPVPVFLVEEYAKRRPAPFTRGEVANGGTEGGNAGPGGLGPGGTDAGVDRVGPTRGDEASR